MAVPSQFEGEIKVLARSHVDHSISHKQRIFKDILGEELVVAIWQQCERNPSFSLCQLLQMCGPSAQAKAETAFNVRGESMGQKRCRLCVLYGMQIAHETRRTPGSG